MNVKNTFRDFSLRTKLVIIYVSFTTLIIFAVGLMTYNISIRALEKSKQDQLLQNLKQTNRLIDFNFETYYRKCESIFSSTIIQEALGADYSKAELTSVINAYQNALYKTIEPIMQDVRYPSLTLKTTQSGLGTDMIKVEIYSNNSTLTKDGELVKEFSEISEEPWTRELLGTSNLPYWRGRFIDRTEEYVSVNRVLRDFNDLRELGVLSIKVPVSRLEYLLSIETPSENVSIYLFDRDGQLVTAKKDSTRSVSVNDMDQLYNRISTNQSGITILSEGNNPYLIAFATSELSGWKLVATYPNSEIANQLLPIQYTVFIVLIAGIVVSILITVMTAFITTRRLQGIKNKIEMLKTNRHLELQVIPGNDEVGQLDKSFNDMILTINELAENEKKLQMNRAGLQIELLQSQINPHILYNTLAAIKWRAKKEGILDISLVTDKMTRFFKYFLNKGIVIASFENELNMITQYVDILRFTYELEIDYQLDIEPRIYHYYSLNLILQPLVENAIVHGLHPLTRPGVLAIKGWVSDASVQFTIRDNGLGITIDNVEKLNADEDIGLIKGYGLRNVKRRIDLYFGSKYGLKISSQLGEGTIVNLTLPILEEGEVDLLSVNRAGNR